MSADKDSTPVVHVRLIDGQDEARAELRKIGVDSDSEAIMAPKMRHVVVKIKDLDVRAANILKQEMLGKGAEAAVAKWASGFTVPTTDVLLMGTIKQYRFVLKRLKAQPFGLRALAGPLERALAGLEPLTVNMKCGAHDLALGRHTRVMGILNLTTDSFSDGGRFFDPNEAVRQAHAMVEAGADIIDVGGESTRPGAQPVDTEEEARRVVPVVRQLVRELAIPISVDTSKAAVAVAAIDAGAAIINDVTALRGDPDMARVCAAGGVGVVLMHMLGEPRTMQENPEYEDLIADIVGFLGRQIEFAAAAGIPEDRLLVDPGFGFGKTVGHNLEIVKRLAEFRGLGRPIVLGASRKSSIGAVLGGLGVSERLEGTAAAVTAGILAGAAIIRVHDVKEMARTAHMTDAIKAGENWNG